MLSNREFALIVCLLRLVIGCALVTWAMLAIAADGSGVVRGDGDYADSFKTLVVMFVAAVLLESALATIINWRPFLDYFDARGVKTVISVAVALVVVYVFDFDAVTRLLKIYGAGLDMKDGTVTLPFPGKFLTAWIIAGGSSGVNNILIALGFRSVRTAEQVKPKPPPDHGWVSVHLERVKAVGPVSVLIGPKGGDTIAGTITGISAGSRVWRYFVRDKGRFPTSGGFALPQDVEFEIGLSGFDKDGKVIKLLEPWGPYKLQAHAIVDIELRL